MKTQTKSILLTRQGMVKLKRNINALEKIRFKKINNDLQHVTHDSELDSEYSAVMDDLILIEQRLDGMKTILRNSKIVNFLLDKGDKMIVDLGAKVKVMIGGIQAVFELVDTMNVDPNSGKISNESPIGRALMGKKEGESVFVPSPIGKFLEIKKVVYS